MQRPRAWIELGAPKTLDAAQMARLQALTADRPRHRALRVPASGKASVAVAMRINDVVLVNVRRVP
ncbi:hypothetical protein ACFFTM_11535 [Pseudoduganella plicata]|uniref:Uncharacterized protein n=1 Tax=Pseudoduganella plicata TaxID=321984 RepID=A0A4P7BD32_9BURK|nr:hypothetical protein [Pseudoduganella plicata]QBQ35932.1 hypothetical protein E1742_07045 [Pseudoduganella plicata]GGY79386.1 hypothetical protein GCM10007388_10530 [Pseudoduganella plicata]